MVNSTDHVTGKTGLTVTLTASKNGTAFGAVSGAVTELSNGWYVWAGNAVDRGTLGELAIHATASGADPYDDKYVVVPWDPFDGAGLGLARVDAAISSRSTYAGGTVASVAGDVGGKVLGGGASSITGTGARVVDASGNNVAPAATALSNATWTDARAAKVDNADAATSTRSSHSAADVWAAGTRTLTSFGTLVADIWGQATSALTTIGSIGKLLVDMLNAAVGTRASQTSLDTHETARSTMATTLVAEHNATQAELSHATYGLSALNTDLDSLLARLTALRAGYLDNLSAGAVALEATLTAIKGAGWTTETLVALAAYVDALETRLTAGRAAALDNLDATISGVPAASGARVIESQGAYTQDQVLRIVLAVLAGVTTASGATFKTPNGVATRAAATLNASNERTAMTLTP